MGFFSYNLTDGYKLLFPMLSTENGGKKGKEIWYMLIFTKSSQVKTVGLRFKPTVGRPEHV